MEGERDEHAGLTRAAQQDIARAEADIEALRQQRQADIAAGLTEARAALVQLSSQIRALEDIRSRHMLRAPQAGRVVEISTVSSGAVIASGQPLMEILPRDDRLIALFRLAPESIDTVHTGLPAQVRLTAYKRSDAPLIDGEVVYVSADLLEDPQTGAKYFEGHVALDPTSMAEQEGISITAGMPVEVTLTIGERRAGDYLLEPILRHIRRALREE
jgi:HlyD family secretion protein